MAPRRSDVIIHIDENLDDERIRTLQREIGQVSGVYSACVNERARHLMLVDYDPADIKAVDILGRLQGAGIHAELIGL